MSTTKQSTGFKPGRGYSEADWDEVSDNPEWTADDIRKARPFAEIVADLAKSNEEQAGPAAGDLKATKVVALDRRVVEKFQSQGDDWQKRINDILRKAVGL